MSEVKVDINADGLDELAKMIGENKLYVAVGILGNNNARKAGEKSNAEVGATHEFGTDKLPIRSFLRMPLTEKLAAYLEKAGLQKSKSLESAIKERTLLPIFKKIGVAGEAVVHEAFATGGFGQWKPSQMDHKAIKQTLVETRQLERSITSEVK